MVRSSAAARGWRRAGGKGNEMLFPRRLGLCLWGMACVAAVEVQAATVKYNIVPASDRNARTRTIRTGTLIKYYLTAEVISDTAEADNSGLALFNVNVETDLTVEQPPATEFIREIFDTFTLFRSLGEAMDDDLIGIGASQSTFSTAQARTGIGQRGAQDLVSGFLQSPNVEGQFVVSVDAENSTANVLAADFAENGGVISAREIIAGPGFTIITANDAGEDPGDEIDAFAGLSDTLRFALGGTAVGIFGLAVVAGLFIAGPWGAAIGLLVGALFGLISLFFNSMTLSGGG